MSKILDQMKSNAVPAAVMRSAAKGALALDPAEMLEILVYLTHNPVFAEEARMTLARWDAESANKVLSNHAAPAEVLGYYWMETNRRPSLMASLIENPSIPEGMLMEIAYGGSHEIIRLLLASKRARSSSGVIEALCANPALQPEELQELKSGQGGPQAPELDHETNAAHQAWYEQHADEIAAEANKPFRLIEEDERHEAAPESAGPPAAQAASSSSSESSAAAAAALGLHARAQVHDEEQQKLTVLQKVGRMSPAERVKAAFVGSRDERSILIRDGARVVQNAVLSSPKLSEPEVETFASAKNVAENVLREIARNRRFMKNYNVVRNLVNNPKCPLDLSLTLIKNLLVYDLKGLRFNKGVPETIRNVAGKLYREKANPTRSK